MAHILLIDDIDAVRRSITSILKRAGHEVVEASGAADGLDKAGRRRFDLVITDILMPEADGMEVIETLRRSQPNMKILAISGGGSLVNSEEALQLAGKLADGALTKPFEADELLAVVDRLVSGGAAA